MSKNQSKNSGEKTASKRKRGKRGGIRQNEREKRQLVRKIHVRTYTSAFTLAMGEVIRILYRSKEKGVVLLNSKAGDFATYSLPRLSVKNWEDEQEAPSRNKSRTCHRKESRTGVSSDLSKKPKVKFKTPCLNVKSTKTRPVIKGKRRSNGT